MHFTIRALVLTGSLASCFAWATDPFLGKWKQNIDVSSLGGDWVIEKVGPHNYKFGGTTVLLVDDGREVRGQKGGINSLKREGDNVWRWSHRPPPGELGHAWVATLKLTNEGQTLFVDADYTNVDGSHRHDEIEHHRVGNGSGLAGVWEHRHFESSGSYELLVEAHGQNGLTFRWPAEKEQVSVKFDGKEYPDTGPEVQKDSVVTAIRVDDHTIKTTEKEGKKIIDTQEWKLSPDGKIITVVTRPINGRKPTRTVYSRED